MWQWLKIVGLCSAATVCYGIVHDNVTARLCVEYFTRFHRRVIWAGDSPTKLALYWGIVATWWMGVGLGVPLATFARWGGPPRATAGDLARPLVCLLLTMGICSATVGGIVHVLAGAGVLTLHEPWAGRINPSRHAAFLADLWAHNTAYAVGFLGGVSLWGWCVRFRRQRAKIGSSV